MYTDPPGREARQESIRTMSDAEMGWANMILTARMRVSRAWSRALMRASKVARSVVETKADDSPELAGVSNVNKPAEGRAAPAWGSDKSSSARGRFPFLRC